MRIWGTFLPSCQYWLIPRLTNIEINNYSCKNVIIWWQKFLMWNFLFVKSTVKVQPRSVFCEWAWLNKNRLLFLRQFKFQRLTCEDPRIFLTLKNFNISPFLCLTPTLSESWFIKSYKIFGSQKFKRRVHRITRYEIFSIKIFSSLIG